jgi:hypothetical protein
VIQDTKSNAYADGVKIELERIAYIIHDNIAGRKKYAIRGIFRSNLNIKVTGQQRKNGQSRSRMHRHSLMSSSRSIRLTNQTVHMSLDFCLAGVIATIPTSYTRIDWLDLFLQVKITIVRH